MPFASPSAMAALGEVKAAWGLERWKALDAATKTKLWNARRAGEDGWTPPDFTPAVTPSPPRDEDSSSGEEEVVESGQAPATPDKDDDGLSGMLSSLSVAPAPAPKDVDGLEEALASISLGPQTPQKKPAAGGPAWDSLRRYQRALVLDVEDRMKSPRARTAARPFASVLLSLATGGGKTRVAAAFLERNCSGEAALFVVNRTVLSIQAQDALRDYCAVVEWDRDLTIKSLADDRPTVYVATIQGLRASGALQKPLDGVACVVIDEAHHGAADSYLSLLFAGLKSNASAKVLGLTATPFRLARDAVLGSAFSSAARGPTVQELVSIKALAAPKLIASTARDRVEARGRDEDATEANLAKLLWLRARQAGAKTAVAFCRDIRRSRLLVDVLRGAGVRAEHLDGSTSEKDRKRTLAELRDGIVEVVANASLLAEGFDEPSLSAVILVRPTQSTALFVQQVGRALRPYPEKMCGFVVDAIGAAEQHGSAFGRLHRLEPDDGGTLARDLSDRAAAPTFRLSAKKAPRRRGIVRGPPPPPDLIALGRKPERPPPPPEDFVPIGGLSVADDSSSGEEEVVESGRVGPASSTPPATGAGDS
jgi:superfamily II DNA or RNA helicase